MEDEEQFKIPALWKAGAIVVVLLIGFFILNPIVIIGAGERGVVLTWGAVNDNVMGEGMNFRVPIAQSVKVMSVQTQKYSATASSASADLQDVSTEVALNYHLDASRVNKIYQTLGTEFGDRIIAPSIQESVKASTAKYTAEELITKRAMVKETIEVSIKTRLEEYGIISEAVSITNFQFSPQFTESIESKVQAEQLALKAENDLRRIKVEAEQRVATAEAEAKAIQIKGDALKDNPGVIQLNWIDKWNGIMPLVFGGSGNIMDITSLVSQQR